MYLSRGSNDSIRKAFSDELQKYMDISDEYIIASRLDNEDAVHEDMINEDNYDLTSRMIYLSGLLMDYKAIST